MVISTCQGPFQRLGKTVQQFRVLAALPEDLRLLPRYTPGGSQLPLSPAPADSTVSSGLCGHSMHMVHNIHAGKTLNTSNKKKEIFRKILQAFPPRHGSLFLAQYLGG